MLLFAWGVHLETIILRVARYRWHPPLPTACTVILVVGSDARSHSDLACAGGVGVGAIALPGYEILDVRGLRTAVHLLPRSSGRCGVYVLVFTDGDRYVGQALDVVVRFAAHRRVFGDEIVGLAFLRVEPDRLDVVERAEIRRLHEAGLPLRNVVDTPGRLGATYLDELVPRAEQHSWLTSPRRHDCDLTTRREASNLRSRHRSRFDRLAADARFAVLCQPLRRYVLEALPFPERTELSYWALSAIPSTNRHTYPRLFTLSVHTLETLFVYTPRHEPDTVTFRMNVDRGVLLERWGSFRRLMSHMPDLDAHIADHYRARPDTAALQTFLPDRFLRLLSIPGILPAARRLNLDLMRKGPTTHWRTHCYDLADIALGLR